MLQLLGRQTLPRKLVLQRFDVSFEDGDGIPQVMGHRSLQKALVFNGPPKLAVVLIQSLPHPLKHKTKLPQLIFARALDLKVKVAFLNVPDGICQDTHRWGDFLR